MRLSIFLQYVLILIQIDVIFTQQSHKLTLASPSFLECAEKFKLGQDQTAYVKWLADANNPNEACLRACIYREIEFLDKNFKINKSKFDTMLKQEGQVPNAKRYEDCLAKTESLKDNICKYATNRVYCFIYKPSIEI